MEILINYYPAPGFDCKLNLELFNLRTSAWLSTGSAIDPLQNPIRISQLILMGFSLSKIEVVWYFSAPVCN